MISKDHDNTHTDLTHYADYFCIILFVCESKSNNNNTEIVGNPRTPLPDVSHSTEPAYYKVPHYGDDLFISFSQCLTTLT